MKRKFEVAALQMWGLPWGMADGRLIEDEVIDSGRWTEYHQVVFRAPDDDKLWRVGYEVGLTEMQGSRPWDEDDTHVDADGYVEGVHVEPHEVTVVQYRPVGEGA